MCASYLLPVHLFSNCMKLCGAKLNRGNVVCNRSVLNVVYRVYHTRRTCGPLIPGNLWLCPQKTLVWSQSACHSTIMSGSEPALDSTTSESAQIVTAPASRPLRKNRLEQQSLFREMIHNKGDLLWTDDDWLQVANSVSLTDQESWEVMCMHTLYVDKNISVARSLMEYLERHKKAASVITLTFYIGLLGETCANLDVQHEETYQYYQHLLSRTSILDAASIEVLISGLSSTRYYKECMKLLETCRETSYPNSISYVKLLLAGIRNHDLDVCQIALSENEQQSDPTGMTGFLPKVVEEGLSSNNQKGLQIVMDFFQRNLLLLKRAELEEVVNMFHRYQPNQWTANYGFINHRSGCCTICGHQMKRTEVDSSDFQSIQATFLDQVIVGSNVFFKSTPEEVDSFMKYVQKMGPFDVVIDGLNVMYHNCRRPDMKQLEKAVEYFTSQGKRVLVLGNGVLNSLIPYIKKLTPRPSVYMTSTTKCDDAFFLYAALLSGKHTLVVSSDKLRDHKFLLKPSLRPIFHQWVRSAQVYDWFISKSGQFVIGKRHLYVTGPAKDDGGWHIPENDISAAHPFGKFSVLCLRNKTGLRDCHDADANNKSFTQTVCTGRDLGAPRHVHNTQYQQNLTRPGRNKTATTGESSTTVVKSNKTQFHSEKEWFDN